MTEDATLVTIELGERGYPVRIGHGEVASVGAQMAALDLGRRALVVTNAAIARRYAHPLLDSLDAAGIEAGVAEIPAGERYKHLGTIEKIWSAAMARRLDRHGVLIALGGGVVGDMAGFAAACYYRGISFVQVPTTLVAMVDSSVGGKTGVNFHGKNLIGAFWQPNLVCADLDTLASLPTRELRCGLAEVIKHGAILDLAMFERLESAFVTRPERGGLRLTAKVSLSPDTARYSVVRSCQLKGQVVAADERESGQRAWLNFGHTFGHALEATAGYGKLHHGEAVSIGMVLAARLGVLRGDLEASDAQRLEAVCAAVGLPTKVPAGTDPEVVFAAMGRDKKAREGQMRLTLLTALGQATVAADTPPEMILSLLRQACVET
ncbi:MAG: 3-dehydroquinate synthase [Armatimonadetes bacterium]|nr:3-dehydroquinate synthase [Armatimonadota bacterium]